MRGHAFIPIISFAILTSSKQCEFVIRDLEVISYDDDVV
jgi:hypothetical protein